MTDQQEKRLLYMKSIAREMSRYGAVLKGGTALLIAYGLDRFSEDVDFDLPVEQKTDFLKVFKQAAEKVGITLEHVCTKKDTDTASRYTLHTQELGQQPLKVDISHRQGVIPKDEIRVCDGINVYPVATLGYSSVLFPGVVKSCTCPFAD